MKKKENFLWQFPTPARNFPLSSPLKNLPNGFPLLHLIKGTGDISYFCSWLSSTQVLLLEQRPVAALFEDSVHMTLAYRPQEAPLVSYVCRNHLPRVSALQSLRKLPNLFLLFPLCGRSWATQSMSSGLSVVSQRMHEVSWKL